MELNTVEKFLILAHHPTRARYKIPSIHLKYGIAGAILLELSLRKKIVFQNECIRVNDKIDPKDEDFPVFEQLTQTIAQSKKEHKPRFWIQKFGRRPRKLKWEFLIGLEKKRLIKIKKLKFLWIPYRRSFLIEKSTRDSLIYKLRESLLYKKKKSEEDLAILGLVESCRMYRIIEPDRSNRKIIRKELKLVLSESPTAQIIAATIKQIKIAIAMAIAASSGGAAGASH